LAVEIEIPAGVMRPKPGIHWPTLTAAKQSLPMQKDLVVVLQALSALYRAPPESRGVDMDHIRPGVGLGLIATIAAPAHTLSTGRSG
jgi:hypothetical protein